jgi:hypothetical protein
MKALKRESSAARWPKNPIDTYFLRSVLTFRRGAARKRVCPAGKIGIKDAPGLVTAEARLVRELSDFCHQTVIGQGVTPFLKRGKKAGGLAHPLVQRWRTDGRSV